VVLILEGRYRIPGNFIPCLSADKGKVYYSKQKQSPAVLNKPTSPASRLRLIPSHSMRQAHGKD
jgi:hypothetical protein